MISAELMGRNEYARHRGCAPNAVKKAEDDGRIAAAVKRGADGAFIGIDARLADELWARNTDPMEAAKNGKVSVPEGQLPLAEPNVDEAPARGGDDQHGYLASRASREHYQAERARLDLLERLGQVVSHETVRDETFSIFRRLRDSLFLVGPRISQKLAAETDPLRIEQAINDEHRTLLNELSRALALDAAGGVA